MDVLFFVVWVAIAALVAAPVIGVAVAIWEALT